MKTLLIACLAVAAIAGISGYSLRNLQCNKAKAEAALVAEKAKVSAVTAALKEEERRQTVDDKITTAYIAQLEYKRKADATLIEKLKKQIPAHQQANSECNLTRGTVSVLNDSVRGTSNSATSETANLTLNEAAASSTVTESVLIQQCNAWVAEYEQLYLQLNALIEWHDQIVKGD